MISYLALALPVLKVLDVTTTAEVDVFAGAYEHVWGGYDVYDRVFLWIVSSDPDRDWNVVGRLTVSDGKNAVKTEQQEGPSVVISCGRGMS